MASLGDLLFGQTRGRTLALLYGSPDETFFVRQIAREIKTSVGTLQRELATLSRLNLVERSVIGRQVFYRANRNHPAFAEMQSLLAKTFGIYHLLHLALAPLAEEISFAFVYGSIARNEENASSDVDLMVIGDVTLDQLLTRLNSIERAIGRSINPTIYSLDEFQSKINEKNHFLSSVMRGKKVLVIGDENELRKVGRIRLAQS